MRKIVVNFVKNSICNSKTKQLTKCKAMDTIKVNLNEHLEAVHFWNALKIYCHQPKSINKQVLFSENVLVAQFESSLTLSKCQDFFTNFYYKLAKECTSGDCIRNIEFSEFGFMEVNDVEEVFLFPNRMYLFVRKLIPKLNVSDDFGFFEFIFLDKLNSKVYIFTKATEECSNESKQDPLAVLKFNFLQLSWDNKVLKISYNRSLSDKGVTWLNATFAPKFKKLLFNVDSSYTKDKNSGKLQFDSKVDIVQYYKFYKKMKLKYAKYFLENWTENTDPKKFVYEDIGIATYLLMLWDGGNIPTKDSKKQKFVDLGCGNGLLVHILNSEGHWGIGMDMRKRKIWDIYPPATVLQEEVIIPTSETTYPEADWLIGNHSDELTAWIPVMARLSSNHCQYFVLPCCPYQLNGMKFQRKNSGCSSYQDFINYVKGISRLCKFDTYVDKLRIPSTKRIGLIGLNKPDISEEKYSSVKQEIIKLIQKECQSCDHDKYNVEKFENEVSLNFKVRELVEPVRNCTKLPVEVVDNVLETVMNELLRNLNICTVIKDGKPSIWNRGGKLQIGELASCLNKKILQQLKNECKGLQTLLKNHHFLFEVNQGFVQFRSPESMLMLCNKFLETQSQVKWKLKKCWFFYNHPDKCPLSDDVCSYSHEKKSTQL